jgi:hypothetical protein
MRFATLLALSLGLSGGLATAAPQRVVVTLFSLPEDAWQTMQGATDEPLPSLWTRLQIAADAGAVRVAVNAEMALVPGEVSVFKRGEEQRFSDSWRYEEMVTVRPRQTAKRFVGTLIKADCEAQDEPVVDLTFSYDVAAPELRRFNYATQAQGAERGRLSVEYPAFEKLDWQGQVELSTGEWQPLRLATFFQSARRMRHVLFLGRAATVAAPASPMRSAVVTARQTIIRAPEMEVAGMLGTGHLSDALISAQLREWVKTGRAHVVSEVAAASHNRRGELRASSGRWLPFITERDQDFDHLVMAPVSFRETLVGTSLVLAFGSGLDSCSWKSRYVPREPQVVPWPVSWLEARPAPHGWLDSQDEFVETMEGMAVSRLGGSSILGALPTPDLVWPGEGEGVIRSMDVYEALLSVSGAEEQPEVARRFTLLGFSMDARSALEWSLQREPDNDEAMLQLLLAEARAGKARLCFCTSAKPEAGARAALASGREHNYPTEMPSIPSAWEMGLVGTQVEMEASTDAMEIALMQSFKPPGPAVWQLALDDPSLIMHQPRFRALRLNSQVSARADETRLIGLVHVPQCLDGAGLSAQETMLVFARSDIFDLGSKLIPKGKTTALEPHAPDFYEAELVVVEVPVAEAEQWSAGADGRTVGHFETLMQRVAGGSASLVAHLVLQLSLGQEHSLGLQEEVLTATEFDPPREGYPDAIRPTALEMIPSGSRWGLRLTRNEQGELWLDHALEQATALPAEPTTRDFIDQYRRAQRTQGADVPPQAKRFEETWQGKLRVRPGEFHGLGLQTPVGDARGVRHVAFVRVRRVAP